MNSIAIAPTMPSARPRTMRSLLLPVTILLALALTISLIETYRGLPIDDELVSESTLGRLSLWMAGQSGGAPDELRSPLARYAANWAAQLGQDELDPAVLLGALANLRSLYLGAVTFLLALALLVELRIVAGARGVLLAALLMLAALLFDLPTVESSDALARVILAILLTTLALVLRPSRITRAVGFCLTLALLMVGWEAGKAFADSVSYKILLPQAGWQYRALPTLDEALTALQSGRVDVVIADRKDLDDLMPPQPPGNSTDALDEDLPYPDLRYLRQMERSEGLAFLPISPAFPGRLSIALRAEDALQTTSARQIFDRPIATVSGDFADARFLSQPRSLVLLDLKILKDLNLPHLQMIAEAFAQPARRNGELLLLRILAEAGAYTFSEAIFGFVFGAALGFMLGAFFAHSRLLERGLLPYVVASQTVPILAIAPMVVIWLGAGPLSVAVIAAYLTFFPVTINTLRGMQSPATEQVELMRSYAAGRWTIMWKLRLPAALPYIFTALKVSATASVVGAIIGELPSGIGDGLGRAILDFSSDYSLISTPKLWASIVMAAAVGMVFFAAVSLCERVALRSFLPSEGART
ncbi:MAG: ABC transporter permease [Chloroflexi bacterium]|nr:ABC transporter permease [Chloroflexota bacterium]MCY4246361.1 ABC transporter permease [Chloroflexota bacterium]